LPQLIRSGIVFIHEFEIVLPKRGADAVPRGSRMLVRSQPVPSFRVSAKGCSPPSSSCKQQEEEQAGVCDVAID
jgi:hypothetical protein